MSCHSKVSCCIIHDNTNKTFCWQDGPVSLPSTPANLQVYRTRSTASSANISSVPGQSIASKPEKFSFVKGVDYNFEEPKYSMILNARPVGVPPGAIDSTMIDHHGVFISCEEYFFEKGIDYSAKYFENVFPIAWIIILDARASLKNLLYTQLGTGSSQTLVSSNATNFMVQLTICSALVGQPVERGLECRSTSRTATMSTSGSGIVSLVRKNGLQLHLFRTSIHRLRTKYRPFNCP